jgi:small neutral amino acid transporter SnatA (MarC family)
LKSPAGCCCFWSRPRWCSARASSSSRRPPNRRSKIACATSRRFPIAIPLTAGAIAATALLSAAAYSVMWVLLILVIVAVCGATFLVFVSASEISRFLGITGNVVLTRLLGMILAALAVQYVIDGIRAVIGPGAGVH